MAFVFAAAALLALPCGAHACPDHAAVVQAVSASWQGEPASVGSHASRHEAAVRAECSAAAPEAPCTDRLCCVTPPAAPAPDCVLRLRPPARHRFPSRRHERHPRQGLSASEILKLRALRPHAFRTDSRPSASLKLLFSETHKMEMTHYMELMMGSWHMLVLFMAAPMLLAECYVVSEILLLIKPRQGDALAAFNKASAYAAALGIALLSGCVALQFSSVVAWRTWVDAVSALAYVAAGLPFIYVGLLEAASSPAAGRPSGRDARPSRRWSSISSSPTPPWSSGCSIPCSSAGGLRTTCT